MARAVLATVERFWSKVRKTDGCWEWTIPTKSGYGGIRVNNRCMMAHRFSYEMARGPIPEGMQLDHLCRNRSCVNPEHLESVTIKENLLRGNGYFGVNSRKTECPKGHELSGDNLVKGQLKIGKRDCRICYNERSRARSATRRSL